MNSFKIYSCIYKFYNIESKLFVIYSNQTSDFYNMLFMGYLTLRIIYYF